MQLLKKPLHCSQDQDREPQVDPQLCAGPFHHHRYTCRERVRIFKEILKSEMLPSGGDLLDYGCGVKPYEPLFREKFKTHIGVDMPGNPDADHDLDVSGRIPLEDDSFDLVLSSQVLEHVEVPASYLAEARRVLRDKGLLLLSTHGLYLYHPVPNDYWRWTHQGLRREIELAGFEIVSMRSIESLTSCAVHLWELGTMGKLPRGIRHLYIWIMQGIITTIERLRRNKELSANAVVYVVLARSRK